MRGAPGDLIALAIQHPTSNLCRPLANAQYKAYNDECSLSAVSTKYWTPAGLVKLFIDEWGLRASHSRIIRLPVGETWHSAQSDTFLDGGGTALLENGCHDDSGLRIDVKINGTLYFSEK